MGVKVRVTILNSDGNYLKEHEVAPGVIELPADTACALAILSQAQCRFELHTPGKSCNNSKVWSVPTDKTCIYFDDEYD